MAQDRRVPGNLGSDVQVPAIGDPSNGGNSGGFFGDFGFQDVWNAGVGTFNNLIDLQDTGVEASLTRTRLANRTAPNPQPGPFGDPGRPTSSVPPSGRTGSGPAAGRDRQLLVIAGAVAVGAVVLAQVR